MYGGSNYLRHVIITLCNSIVPGNCYLYQHSMERSLPIYLLIEIIININNNGNVSRSTVL